MNDKTKIQREPVTRTQEVPGDPPVYYAQVWLNETYGNISNWVTLDEDGLTGQGTISGLVRALQYEIGTGVDGGFGAGTEAAFESYFASSNGQLVLTMNTQDNIYNIVKAALWCKGYYGAYDYNYDGYIDNSTIISLSQLKQDAGIHLILLGNVISAKLMKSLLSMDQFVLMESAGGKSEIREIQQYLNGNFGDYIGIIPCDGIYQRSMNEALIKRLQYIEGQRGSAVDGIFGSGTQSLLPILDDNNHPAEAVRLFNFCLTCNGYTSSGTDWSPYVEAKTRAFQGRYLLTETGHGDVDTWMALLLSKGNPDRTATGCDCATILDSTKANALYNAGYRIVGRYLSGTVGSGTSMLSKALTKSEMTSIFEAGLSIFAIFQEGVPSLQRYTYDHGKEDATTAISAAKELDIPMREYIYFAIDYDVLDGYISSTVKPYFEGINEVFEENGFIYNVGIYGSRNVCSRICDEYGLASSCFVGDMSTGFSGNMGFPLPRCWAFDQFHEYSFSYIGGLMSFPLDKDAVSGTYLGFSEFGNMSSSAVPVTDNQKRTAVYDIIKNINGVTAQFSSAADLNWESPSITIPIYSSPVRIEITYKHSSLFDLAPDKMNYVTYSISNSNIIGISTSYASSLFETASGTLSTETGIDIGDDCLEFILQLTQNVENGKISFGVSTTGNQISVFAVIESYLGSTKHINNSISVKIKLIIEDDEVQQSALVKERIKEFAYGAAICFAIAGVMIVAGQIIVVSGAGATIIAAINSLAGAIVSWFGTLYLGA